MSHAAPTAAKKESRNRGGVSFWREQGEFSKLSPYSRNPAKCGARDESAEIEPTVWP